MVLTPQELKDAERALELIEQWEEKRTKLIQQAAAKESKGKILNFNALIAVHLTNYFPEKGVIKPLGQATLLRFGTADKALPRQTIHFSLNGAVSANIGGDWTSKKYAILIPLDLIINRIYCLNSADTYIVGSLNLSKYTEILGKEEDLRGKNGGLATLISISKNEGLDKAVWRRIAEKGYVPISIGGWGWSLWESEDWGKAKALAKTLLGEEDIPDVEFVQQEMLSRASAKGFNIESHGSSFFIKVEKHAGTIYRALYDRKDMVLPSNYRELLVINTILLKEVLSFRSQLAQRRAPYSFPQEAEAVNYIIKILEDINLELEKGMKKWGRKLVPPALAKEIRIARELSEAEKEWLMREFDLTKKLKEQFTSGATDKVQKLLRKIGNTEKKVYKVYRKIQERLDSLNEQAKSSGWLWGERITHAEHRI
ncbi:MAG: hypothetical protein AABY26_01090, partial [Nanoarchaeota archaeon]